MKRKKTLALLTILFLLSPLFAKAGYTMALGSSTSYYMSIPHFEDELPFRSSYAYGFTLSPLGFSLEHFDASIDLKYRKVSDSIVYGNYIARGFTGWGIGLRLSFGAQDRLGFFLSGGTEINIYDDIEECFASFSFEAGPQITLLQTKGSVLDLTFPLGIQLRKEITAPTLGVGIRYTFFPEFYQMKGDEV
jgi:hypothetical protein